MSTHPLPSRREFLAVGVGTAAWWAAQPLAAQIRAAQSRDLTALTLKQASDMVRQKRVSPLELTDACLARIEKYDKALNSFITVTGEQARAAARSMADELARGRWRGPLHGMPIALKDNIDTAGIRTTAATGAFKDRVPTEDAEVVRRLKNAGAVLLGKLNMHEIAMGGSSAVSFFGAVHNPWALDRTPGGSSGGPGAAVAANLCYGALGTDTAGSVRIPASYCSIVGFKPTYGRVSIRGVVPLAWTLDHVGPMCRTVEDAALMLHAIAGYDAGDTASVDMPVPDYGRAMQQQATKLRVGIPRSPFFDSLNPEVATAVDAALGVIRRLTASTADVKLPRESGASIIATEAYAYHEEWITKTPELYSESIRQGLQRAANARAGSYARALVAIAQARREIRSVFETVDVLVTPTMPEPPMTIAESAGRMVSIRNTSPFDSYGIPTISVPCGFTASGLPIGLQISAAPWKEGTALALAHAYEQATEWHTKRPPLALP